MTVTDRLALGSSQDLLVPIADLDLTMVKMKLGDPDEGLGWSLQYSDRVEAEYRRYLALSLYYPDKAIVPSKIVDSFWHGHILDTQAYASDCKRIFGFFLHHYPYFGMRGEEDAEALGAAYDETLDLYEQHFGAPPMELWARSGAARCPNCGNKCK